MELIQVANKIKEKVHLLEKGRMVLDERAKERAIKISEYDKKLAIAIIQMKENHPVTLCEKIAKGSCYQARLDMEVADALYKSANSKLDCIKAELNGLQSINRYLKEV